MSLRDSYTYEEPTEGGFKVLPKGEYDFTVDEIFDWEESKKGNDMLPICILVEGVKMNDWLVFVESVKFKIDAFMKSIFGGPPTVKVDFENTGWLQGRKGRVRLGIVEKPNNKGVIDPDTGKLKMVQFNEIEAYVYESSKIEGRTVVPAGGGNPRPRPGTSAPAPAAAPADDFEDEDPPF